MKTILKIISLTIVSLLSTTCITASHIVGGDATYSFVGHNEDRTMATYQVTFTIFRDEDGIDYEPLATFGIYRLIDNDTWVTDRVIDNIPIINIQEFSTTDDPCNIQTYDGINVQSGEYSFLVTLPVIDNYYKIAYQKCCRNHAINNIKDAGTTGAVFDIKISAEAQRTGNSSPVFTSLPPTYICVNQPLNYRQSGRDPDGNELRYSFCVPYVAGGIIDYTPQCCDCQNPEVGFCPPPFDEVTYNTGYSYDNPIGGSPQVTIDPITGVITGIPDQIGAYVVGVCIEELKDGQVISETRRDFQFNVVECTSTLSASLIADTVYINSVANTEKTINGYNLCHNESLTIINQSTKIEYINDYSWTIRNENNSLVYDSSGNDLRDLYIEELKSGSYQGEMILNKSELCSDTAHITIIVNEEIKPDFTYDYDPCYMSEVHFTPLNFEGDESIIHWNWNLGDGTSLDAVSGAYAYKDRGEYNVVLTVTDTENCSYAYEMTVDYNPMTAMPEIEIIEIEKTICEGDYYLFDDIPRYEQGNYEYIVPTADNLCDSIHYFLYLDYYADPILETIQKNLCPEEAMYFNGIEIHDTGSYYTNHSYYNTTCDSLIVELIIEDAILPDINLITDTTITIRTDYALPLSIDGDYSSILWTPDYSLDCNNCKNPIANLSDNQTYIAKIRSIDGCEMNKEITIDVEEHNIFYIANIISKSKGNNTLYVQTRSEIKYQYDMYIYDRYGNQIHKCLDAICNESSLGWTPQDLNPGVFAYLIKFKDEFYKETLSGSITIIE